MPRRGLFSTIDFFHAKVMCVCVGDLPGEEDGAEFYARYEPREVLGRGLVSVVRKCIEKASGLTFAVKIIDIGSDEGRKIVDETKREIVILKVGCFFDYLLPFTISPSPAPLAKREDKVEHFLIHMHACSIVLK